MPPLSIGYNSGLMEHAGAPNVRRDCHRAPAAGPFGQPKPRKQAMRMIRTFCLGLLASFAAMTVASAQQQQKPNILFIMGDDIGWMQPSIYHRGLMVGETPNIDRIGQELSLIHI